jgi:hypothetical protein
LAKRLLKQAQGGAKYCDPSCGAGDLLLSAARRFPVERTLRATLKAWGERLAGTDLHPEFVRAARARLVLLAREKGLFNAPLTRKELAAAFYRIRVADGLAQASPLDADVVLMNPPYFAKRAPRYCEWSNGKVNYAAVFVAHYLARMKPGAQLVAILPEVLRSGSNYRRWREVIGKSAAEIRLQSCGLFDANADVDVFMLALRRRRRGTGTWDCGAVSGKLSDHFTVGVGAVVPHRDLEQGAMRRFIDARTAPSFGTVWRVKKRRRFDGPTVTPPFVTIKRTSRPGDKNRAVPTVVRGNGAVAVENHLIVCRPKDGTVRACTALLEALRAPEVSAALNRRIRCRHLTVGAVRSIDVSLPLGVAGYRRARRAASS